MLICTDTGLPGIASVALVSIILYFSEASRSLNLSAHAGPSLTTLRILQFGGLSQRQLVRRLTFGAVK